MVQIAIDASKTGMRVLAFGIKKEDVKTMLHDNPAKLMYLD